LICIQTELHCGKCAAKKVAVTHEMPMVKHNEGTIITTVTLVFAEEFTNADFISQRCFNPCEGIAITYTTRRTVGAPTSWIPPACQQRIRG
jgi:hypothetical protein